MKNPLKSRKQKEKTLGNTDVKGTKENVSDVEVFGNGDTWKLICKASSQSEGWMKSTKAMVVPGGLLIQVTTQQRNPDGSYSLTDSISGVVEGAKIKERKDGEGKVVSRSIV